MAEKNESIDSLMERSKASCKVSSLEMNDLLYRFDMD